MVDTTTATTGSTVRSFAPEFTPLASLVGGAAEAEMSREYTPYGGIRTMGFDPYQQATQANLMGLATPTQFAGATTGITGAQASAAAPGALSGFISPFSENVTDIAARQAMRDFGREQTARDYQFSKAGAFGGSRQGIADAEALRNLNQQLQDSQLKGDAMAYQAAIDQFNKERSMQLESGKALAQTGEAMQQGDLNRLGSQMGVGNQWQQLGQQQLDTAYQDFINQRDWARNQTGWASGVLSGNTANTGATTTSGTSVAPQPAPANPWGQVASAGVALSGLAGMLGSSNSGSSSLGNNFGWW